MTGVELILAALAAGAGAGTTDAAKTVVVDAYAGLRDALRRRLADRRGALEVLDTAQTDPGVWQTRIGYDLADSGADRDEGILAAARHLLELADPDGVHAGKYTVDLASGQIAQVGDANLYVGTAYGPTAGTMTGPVSVTYGQLPVPPARPEA